MIDEKSLKFTPSHEWVHIEGDVATVGISRFAVDQLTDIILIDLSRAAPGHRVEAGRSFGEIESVKAVADLYSPVSGEVLEVNSALEQDVQLLSKDPYESGWILRVRLDDPRNALADMLDFDTYKDQVAADPH